MAMDVPGEVDPQALRERLDIIARELCIDLVMEPA